jgi:hypothetical protein
VGAVAAYTTLRGGTLASVGGAIAAAGALGIAVAVTLRAPFLLPWALGVAAGGYLLGVERRSTADGWSAVVGAALLLAAELAFWSIDDDRRLRADRGLALRRSLGLAALVVLAALVGFVLVGTAAVATSAGLLATMVGVGAAVAALALLLRLVRA